jgi:hypothetical protein
VKDDEYGTLLRHIYKFFWCAAAGSGKSAYHFLHRKTPLFKNRSDETDDFKN